MPRAAAPLASTPLPTAYALLSVACALLSGACAPKWRAPLLVDTREVARALHDPVEIGPAFDPKTVPVFEPPKKLRPCCAFGQDLKAELGPVPVPLYKNENIRGPEELGPHGYDKGELTRERNGLVYTCRGGFIDIAHVRDTGDKTMFLALRIVRALPNGVTIDLPEEGTLRRVVVAPVPAELLARHGRWATATALASWAAYHLSTWHEVVTWYGFESVKGVSERLSAFSPEDIYSNVLGINIAAGIVMAREVRSREEYDAAMEAWIREALRRLGGVPKEDARAAMQAVDGLWWDSSKRVPDFRLVSRRYIHHTSPVSAWRVADAFPAGQQPPAAAAICKDSPAPLPLIIDQKLGDAAIEELVTVRFEFSDWLPEKFPLPANKGDVVTSREFKAVLDGIREQGAAELGPGFDEPRRER